MNALITIVTIMAAFAAVHERVIELIREYGRRFFSAAWIDRNTKGAGNAVLAVCFALATHADFLALLDLSAGAGTKFIAAYLDHSTWGASSGEIIRSVVGCIMMGLAAGLGSQFWHDVVKFFVDLRDKTKSIADQAKAIATLVPPQRLVLMPQNPPDTTIS